MAREDTSSGTEADAGAFEQERGAGLVPVICGAPVVMSPCSCVLPRYPLHHQLDHRCLHGERCGS